VIESWDDLKKLLFVQCAGDHERAAGVVPHTFTRADSPSGRKFEREKKDRDSPTTGHPAARPAKF